MKRNWKFVFLASVSAVFFTGEMASPLEKNSKVDKDWWELLKAPSVLRPAGREVQRMTEMLSEITGLEEDDFIWLQVPEDVCDGGIRMWAINRENVLKAAQPVYFPEVYRFFTGYGESPSFKNLDLRLLNSWRGMEFRHVPLERELSAVVESLYKALGRFYDQPGLDASWSICAACNPQYDNDMMGQDVLVAAGRLGGEFHGFNTGMCSMTVVQAWEYLCLLLHDSALFGVLGQDEQLWLAMQGERLLELIERIEKGPKPEKWKGVVEKESFGMEYLTLPGTLKNEDIWLLLFPEGGSGLSRMWVEERKAAKGGNGRMTVDAQGLNMTESRVDFASVNWKVSGGEESTSAPHFAYVCLHNMLPEKSWKESVADYNRMRRKKGWKDMDAEAVAVMVFRLGYISRARVKLSEEEWKSLATKKDAWALRWHGPGNGKEDKAFAEQWKNGCGDFIRLSASSSWRNANRVDSDLEEVLYYFTELYTLILSHLPTS